MKRLMEYLPEKYEHSPETVTFQEALQPEVAMLWAAKDYLSLQLNPRTASGPGLALWENAMGVRPAADADLEQRRGRVIAKIRGMGVVDAPLLKAVVESFQTGDVTVNEFPRENYVEICFSNLDADAPADEQAILDAVLEILPAHLGLRIYLRTRRTFRNTITIGRGVALRSYCTAEPPSRGRIVRESRRYAVGALVHTRVRPPRID